MSDTIFADVSEFQVPVDNRYPYQVLSFRSDDGTHRDGNFYQNYAWAAAAADAGHLTCFIVYFYWRTNWADCVNTMRDMVTRAGGPHPKMIAMIDIESGGNPNSNQSAGIDAAFDALASWLGNPRRVIGYANGGDFRTMWTNRPAGVRVIGAGYGSDPGLPAEIAHQYTDGVYGASQGLPMGCAPFGKCDMNSADGLSPTEFAAACGVGEAMALTQDDKNWFAGLLTGFVGPIGHDVKRGNAQLGLAVDDAGYGKVAAYSQNGGRTLNDTVAAIAAHTGVPNTRDTLAPTTTTKTGV